MNSGQVSPHSPARSQGRWRKARLCKAVTLDFGGKRFSVLTGTDTRQRRCYSRAFLDTVVYINFTQEKIIYQSCWCIQMRFKFPSIFSARCFTFKTISFSHCWRLLSLDMRPTCSAPPSIIHFPLCRGLLAPTRTPNAVLLVPLYRTTPSGKFLRLKTRYNGTSRPYCRLWNKSGGLYRILRSQVSNVHRGARHFMILPLHRLYKFSKLSSFPKMSRAAYPGAQGIRVMKIIFLWHNPPLIVSGRFAHVQQIDLSCNTRAERNWKSLPFSRTRKRVSGAGIVETHGRLSIDFAGAPKTCYFGRNGM